ncbi:MAG: hypothetical protein KDA69_08695 [Planctomycetaceae bacterium]|nr:hypothetical protein [Planctomycetaceae bacterium]
MASTNQFKVTTPSYVPTADPTTSQAISDIGKAMAGGGPLADLFNNAMSPLNLLIDLIATSGDAIWQQGVDQETGLPVMYVADGTNFLSLGISFTENAEDALQNGTGSTTDFTTVASNYVTLTTNQGTSQQTVNTIEYAGLGIGGLGLGVVALTLLKNAVKFVKTAITKNRQQAEDPSEDPSEGEDEADSDIEAGLDEASEEGVEIAENVTCDFVWGLSDTIAGVVGIGVMGIVLVIKLLEKQMYNYVRFYNATAIDVDFGICWVKGSTGVQIAPAPVGQQATINKIQAPATPPWVTTSDTAITFSQLHFINNNVLEGIGYVLQAQPNGDFPGFRVMVDIPNSGDNSLYVGFGTQDCEGVWNTQKNLNYGLTSKVTQGNYTLAIGTNVTSGKSPSPIDKSEGYNYEHIIVLSDGTVDFDNA